MHQQPTARDHVPRWPTVDVRAVVRYDQHRLVARSIKRRGPMLLWAAWRMRHLVPAGSTLVAVPASTGTSAANVALARILAAMTGSTSADLVVRTHPTPSRRMAHRAGTAGTFDDAATTQRASLRVDHDGRFRPQHLVLVDNVVTTGATLTAAAAALREAFSDPHGGDPPHICAVVYADARTPAHTSAHPRRHVITSGGRRGTSCTKGPRTGTR